LQAVCARAAARRKATVMALAVPVQRERVEGSIGG